MTWRQLAIEILKDVAHLDETVDVEINVPTSDSVVMARHVSLAIGDSGALAIHVYPKVALMTAEDVEAARQDGRNQAEMEAEKAAMEKAERDTLAELEVWLGKRIGV